MARKTDQRLSYCLKHQERLTDTRCGACLKPICEECTLATELGNFCGSECYEKRLASNDRLAEFKTKEEASRGSDRLRALFGFLFKLLFIAGIFVLYTLLPGAWKLWIAKSFKGLWKAIKG